MSDEMRTIDPWIFVCYRRGQGRSAAPMVAAELAARIGADSIFCDVSSIDPGDDWFERILKILQGCHALVVVIDDAWITHDLHDPNDWVRREVRISLERNIFILPILLDGVTMPKEEQLPSDMNKLFRKQAYCVDRRTESIFKASIGLIANDILSRFPMELVLVREEEGWWESMVHNNWEVFLDDGKILALKKSETSAIVKIPVSTGVHALHIRWDEREKDRGFGENEVAGYSSRGRTSSLTIVLRPGRITITLRKEEIELGVWKRVLKFWLMPNAWHPPRYVETLSCEPPATD
jgi:hypothetical protein